MAARYRAVLARIGDDALRAAVAKGYHKLLAYKDEYEVARLLLASRAQAAEAFEGDLKLTYHLAPPILTGRTPEGRPRKRAFGAWIEPAFRLLAKMRALRGTALDPFGYSAERRMERALITEYEADLGEVLPLVAPETRDAAIAWAEVPLMIRGFGPVKQAAAEMAAKRRAEALAALRAGAPGRAAAAE